MTSISEHGGAKRYWRRQLAGGAVERAVLCGNGKLLFRTAGRWRERPGVVVESLGVGEWRPDTRPVVSAAVTRTGRQARRRAAAC